MEVGNRRCPRDISIKRISILSSISMHMSLKLVKKHIYVNLQQHRVIKMRLKTAADADLDLLQGEVQVD